MKRRGPIGVATIWDAPAVSGDVVVVKPADTTENVSAGGTPAAKTFSSFTGDTSAISSYQSVVVNPTGSLSASGSGLGAYTYSGHADGEGYTHLLHAKDASGNILATAIHSIRIAPAASSGGGVTDLLDLNFETLATASPLSNGNQTLTISGKQVSTDFSRYSGANGTVTPNNTVGAVYDGGTDTSGTVTTSFLLSPHFDSYTAEDVRTYRYAVHVVITDLTYPSANNSSVFCGLNRGNTATHNSGIARMVYVEDANDGTNERTRVRRNTSASAIQSTTAIKTSRVFTLILTFGEIVQVMDTSGTTPPTPAPAAASTLMVGSDSVGLAQAVPDYQGNGLRCFVSAGDASDFTLKRILVQRF